MSELTPPGRVRRADGLHCDWCAGPHESFLCVVGAESKAAAEGRIAELTRALELASEALYSVAMTMPAWHEINATRGVVDAVLRAGAGPAPETGEDQRDRLRAALRVTLEHTDCHCAACDIDTPALLAGAGSAPEAPPAVFPDEHDDGLCQLVGLGCLCTCHPCIVHGLRAPTEPPGGAS